MRTCQSILAVLLAFSLISCQSSPPLAPVKPESKMRPGQPVEGYKPSSLIEEYAETQRPTEVVQPLAPKTTKTPEKKPPPGITGKDLPTGLIGPSIHEPGTALPATGDKERQKIVLNFDKADIAEVTSQIFGDQLKTNYVLDQTLQGRISMYIEGEFTTSELLHMVTRAYEANGVSIIP
ncbi:MAG: hypothetical protein AAGU11_24130, partial [Syntrophobacteraceae bacterium]